MCVTCDIMAATRARDWKEVKRLATEADKGKHDDELPAPPEVDAKLVPDQVPDGEPVKAKSSRSSKD